MISPETGQAGPRISRALEQMMAALTILDALGAPGEIGATLDLAIARLQQLAGGPDRPNALNAELEAELMPAAGEPRDAPHRSQFPPV